MEIIPAIDIKDGRCVRLYQGDYSKETVFSEDPASVAREWQSKGATRLHIVDLNGASEGQVANGKAIESILRCVDIPVQVGGGVRELSTLASLLEMGVQRVVIGTAAVEHPDMVREAAHQYREAIVVGIDARDGLVAVRGWKDTTSISAAALIAQMAGMGVGRFIYTDISRDGTMTEPNFEAAKVLVESNSARIIASGGVSNLDHIRKLKEIGVEGVIIGIALYQGAFSLKHAIAAAK